MTNKKIKSWNMIGQKESELEYDWSERRGKQLDDWTEKKKSWNMIGQKERKDVISPMIGQKRIRAGL